MTSISTPASGCSVARRPRRGSGASPSGERLAADHRPRPHLRLDEPQPAAPAREQVLDDVLEVLRRRLEGLLERLADPAVGLLDQPLELRERGLEVGALRLELLDVRHRLLVLLLGERVHRAELLAAAHQALDPCLQLLALLVWQRARWRAPAGSPSRPASSRQVALGVRGGVAHLLRRHLGGGNGLAGVLQPSLELGLLLRAGLQRGGGLLAGGGAGLELLPEGVAPGRDGLACAARAQRPHGRRRRRARGRAPLPRPQGGQRSARAPRARARCARRAAAPRAGLRAARARRTASGPSSGASRRRPITPLGAADDLLGLGRLAQRGAQRALGRLACRIGLGDRGAVALHCCAGIGLLGDGPLGRGHQLVAPAELLEEPLGAAGGRLRQLAGPRVEQAPRLRDGDGAEALAEARRATRRPTRRPAAAAPAPRRPARDAQLRELLPRRAPKARPEPLRPPDHPD